MEPDTDAAREALDAQTSPSRLGQLARASDALARLVARNPSATPGLLSRLARRDDAELLALVCAHPATPDAVAYALATRFPDAFARGARGTDFLADPWGRPPRAVHVRARLRWPDAPHAWFERASLHARPRVRELAAQLTPAHTGVLLARLARDADPAVRAALVLREGLDDATMIALARDPDARVRSAAARQPAMPPGALDALSHDADAGVRHALVHNPHAPVEALERFAVAPSPFMVHALARHPRASERVSATLLAHADATERGAIALCARVLSRETWEQLLTDASERIRHTLAYRTDVSDEVLARLAADPSSLVRSGAARHPRTPPACVERLSRDASAFVRCNVAENPRATEAQLRALARDEDRAVRQSVAKWTSLPSLLASLARDDEARVRLAVFYNRHTPAETKRALDLDAGVLRLRAEPW